MLFDVCDLTEFLSQSILNRPQGMFWWSGIFFLIFFFFFVLGGYFFDLEKTL